MLKDRSTMRRKGFNERMRHEQQRSTRRQRGVQCFSWFRCTGWKWTLALLLTGLGVWQSWFWLRKLNPGQMLTLKHVEIRGNQLISWDEVLQACGLEVGIPMSLLDVDSIQHRLEKDVRIKSVQVNRRFPSALVIQIQEASALYLIQTSKGWSVYSETGHELPILANTALSLPIVSAETNQYRKLGTDFLVEMRATDSLLYTQVSQVVPSVNGLEVFFRNADYSVLFSAAPERKQVFENYRLLAEGSTQSLVGVKTVDMRFHGFGYTIPYQKGRNDG